MKNTSHPSGKTPTLLSYPRLSLLKIEILQVTHFFDLGKIIPLPPITLETVRKLVFLTISEGIEMKHWFKLGLMNTGKHWNKWKHQHEILFKILVSAICTIQVIWSFSHLLHSHENTIYKRRLIGEPTTAMLYHMMHNTRTGRQTFPNIKSNDQKLSNIVNNTSCYNLRWRCGFAVIRDPPGSI